ncbi:MAG TPA: glucosamine-6-phosphate deaminase [Haloplasmataceae bacterium]
MDIHILENYEELSKSAAQLIIKQVKQKKDTVLGLATGSSPLGIYAEIIKDHQENHTSYKDVITFNLDEYFGISKSHPQSYYHFMKENLFNHLDINPNNIHIPSGETEDIEQECQEYNKKLENYVIDIQLLGIGANGHIGFNEPGTSFSSVTHYVKLDEKTRTDNARFFHSLDEVPTHAITMGIKNILNAKQIILVASGINKADAIYNMIKGPIDTNCPASCLQMHDNVVVFLDKLSASKLT